MNSLKTLKELTNVIIVKVSLNGITEMTFHFKLKT